MDFLSMVGRAPGNYIGIPDRAAVPAVTAASTERRGLSTGDVLSLLGGWTRDLAAAGDPDGKAGGNLDQAAADITAKALRDRRAKLAPLLFPDDPRAQYLFAVGDKGFNDAIGKAYDPVTLNPGDRRFGPDGKEIANNPAKPTVLNSAAGVIEYDPEARTTRTMVEAPAKSPPAPSGYSWGDDGVLHFIPNGPADPAVIARVARERRRVVVDNPVPSRARASAPAVASGPTMNPLGAIEAELRRRGALP